MCQLERILGRRDISACFEQKSANDIISLFKRVFLDQPHTNLDLP